MNKPSILKSGIEVPKLWLYTT